MFRESLIRKYSLYSWIYLLCALCTFLQYLPVYAEEDKTYPYMGFCGTYQQILINGNLLYESDSKMYAGNRVWVKYTDYFLPRDMADGSYAFENRSTGNRFTAVEQGKQIPATVYDIYYDSYSKNNFKGLNDNTQHWIREYSGTDGVFYLKNLANGLYLGLSDDGRVISADESQKAEITFKAHPEESPLCLLFATSAYKELTDHQRARLEQIYESVAGDVFDRNGAYKNSFNKPLTPRKRIDGIYESVKNGNTNELNAYLSIRSGDIASPNYAGYIISTDLPGTAGYTAELDPPLEKTVANAGGYLQTTLKVYDPSGNIDQTVSVMVQDNLIAKQNAECFAQVMPQIPYAYRRVVKNVEVETNSGDYFAYYSNNLIGIHIPRAYGRDLMMSKIVHELAHGQDVAYSSDYWHWTDNGEWLEAGEADIFTPTEYGHQNNQDKWNEDFAEFCHFYFASYTNRDWQRALEILFPNRSCLFRKMREENIDGLSLWEEQLGSAFELTLNSCDGTVDPSVTKAYHGGVYGGLPIPTREGCTFDGWYTEDNKPVTDETTVTASEPQTLYAHWLPDIYTKSTLEDNGESVLCRVTITGKVNQAHIIAAAYTGNRLTFVEIRPYNSDTEEFAIDADFDTVKIMLWSGFDDMIPLTNAEILTK